MKTASGLYYGVVQREMGDVISRHFEQLPRFSCAMVLSIDSTHLPSGTIKILAQYEITVRLDLAAAIIAPGDLYRAACRGVFAGFDEVWLFENEPPEEIGPRNRLSSDSESMQRRILATESAMTATNCVLSLASGFGLGYATWDARFAALIESQPE